MLLSELARATGTTAASIKYYRREGLLPPGTRITATRQDYGTAHVERLRLIRVLREEAGASIPDLRELCRVIDDPRRPLVAALEITQCIATGLSVTAPATAPTTAPAEDEDPLVADLLAELGWPDVTSGPRLALGELLAGWRRSGSPVPRDVLLRYGRVLDELARADVDALGEPVAVPEVADGGAGRGKRGEHLDLGNRDEQGTRDGRENRGGQGSRGEPSRDVMVTRAARGMVSFDRLTRILRALGHASHSLLDADDS